MKMNESNQRIWTVEKTELTERMKNNMNTTEKINILEAKLQKLTSSEKENHGVCRKIRRNIRNLKKESASCT